MAGLGVNISMEVFHKIKYLLKHLVPDLVNDFKALTSEPTGSTIFWINGQAKSGTSLVEHIADIVGYVDALRSPLRSYYKCPGYKNGAICTELFKRLPEKRKSFLKTHAPYSETVDNIVALPNVNLVLINRRLEDTLISRFHHVRSDPNHWQFDSLRKDDLDKVELFKRSIFEINPYTGTSSINYFSRWSHSWLTSKFADSILWYEDYMKNPEEWITAVLKRINVSSERVKVIESILNEFRERPRTLKSALGTRRSIFGPLSGTFRRGLPNNYEDYFDEEVLEALEVIRKQYTVDRLKDCQND